MRPSRYSLKADEANFTGKHDFRLADCEICFCLNDFSGKSGVSPGMRADSLPDGSQNIDVIINLNVT
jgi:hypothetical protein